MAKQAILDEFKDTADSTASWLLVAGLRYRAIAVSLTTACFCIAHATKYWIMRDLRSLPELALVGVAGAVSARCCDG